jgi:hypothetical protein
VYHALNEADVSYDTLSMLNMNTYLVAMAATININGSNMKIHSGQIGDLLPKIS